MTKDDDDNNSGKKSSLKMPYAYSSQEWNLITAELQRRVPREHVSSRVGLGAGTRFAYVEAWKLIEFANGIFGFNGWTSSIVSQTVDFLDARPGPNGPADERWSVGVACTVRVSLRDGAFREDVGYGVFDNSRSKALALEKARKEAATDALKRALRQFGNALGNCLTSNNDARSASSTATATAALSTSNSPRPLLQRAELYSFRDRLGNSNNKDHHQKSAVKRSHSDLEEDTNTLPVKRQYVSVLSPAPAPPPPPQPSVRPLPLPTPTPTAAPTPTTTTQVKIKSEEISFRPPPPPPQPQPQMMLYDSKNLPSPIDHRKTRSARDLFSSRQPEKPTSTLPPPPPPPPPAPPAPSTTRQLSSRWC